MGILLTARRQQQQGGFSGTAAQKHPPGQVSVGGREAAARKANAAVEKEGEELEHRGDR